MEAAEPIEETQDADDVMDGADEPVETLSREDTLQAIHALLFTSDRPVSAERLVEALGDTDREMVETLLAELSAQIEAAGLPYTLRELAGGYQLTTDEKFAPYIRRMLQIKRSNKLSKSALETLAIIAYKQPVTRGEVEQIRGVSVSHAFDILQDRRLIKVVGVAEAPGRPKIYRTTDEFLLQFGLGSLKDLPSIEELRDME